MEKHKILVLGGTGAIGTHLVNLLKDSVYNVIVTSRRYHQSSRNITYMQGNAHDLNFLCKLLSKRYKAIVNFMTYRSDEFETVVPLLLKATDQYFFLSSCRSYAGSDEILDEHASQWLDVCKDEEYLQTDDYALAKARQERILRNSKYSNYTIVRPYLTYSEQRLQLGFFEQNSWLLRAMLGKTIVFSDDLAKKYTTLTYGKDVAMAIFLLIGKEQSLGEAINITCTKALLWKEILEIYVDELEKCFGHKIKVLMLQKAPIEDWPSERWTYKYDRLCNRRFSNQKLISIIGKYDFIDPEEGLRHVIRTFYKEPFRTGFSWAQQARFDRITGEWLPLIKISSIRDYLSYMKHRLSR
ncbi:MAG: NAD-dependent epimerase/dehydratase family protein [Clostridia bacterium]|nr:NAD-dependent epimerase/dehydratase family protein [Clostridia bacterium]